MKQNPYQYGIEYVPSSEYSPFYTVNGSIKITLHSPVRYGHPHLFKSRRIAEQYARRLKLKNFKVIPRKIAYRYIARMVEFFSGRVSIVNDGHTSKWCLHKDNERRLTYREVMQSVSTRRMVREDYEY